VSKRYPHEFRDDVDLSHQNPRQTNARAVVERIDQALCGDSGNESEESEERTYRQGHPPWS